MPSMSSILRIDPISKQSVLRIMGYLSAGKDGAVEREALIGELEVVDRSIFGGEGVTGFGDLAQKREATEHPGVARVVGVQQPGFTRGATELALQVGQHAAENAREERMKQEDEQRAVGINGRGGVLLKDRDARGPAGGSGAGR